MLRTALAALAARNAAWHALGYGSVLAIVGGIWSLFGWEWAAIAGGLPFASFYAWVELRLVSRLTRSERT